MNQLNFEFARGQDAILIVDMAPPTSVSGWQGEFFVTNRKGGVVKIFSKTFASGYVAGQSGITVTNGSQGVFRIGIDAVETSGIDFGNYYGEFWRQNSGFVTKLAEGFVTVR